MHKRFYPKYVLRRLMILTVFVGISTATPIFATLTGTALSIIGALYGHDWQGRQPNAYVVVGGGLSKNYHQNQPIITLNPYSYIRTYALWQTYQKNPLPIIASGVEAPWIKDTLTYFAKKENKAIPTVISENASMNTCENVWFSTKLIHHTIKQGQLPPINHVYIISDWYHMARVRRQFAKAGFRTTPIIAPMPSDMNWLDIKSNLNHSRRAFYESVALLRDIIRPQRNCRSPETVSIETIQTPRKQVKTF